MPHVTLYSWAGADGLESSSPYCLKTIYALRYKKIPHQTKLVGARFPSGSRRGTLPIADIEGKRVEDSTRILQALDDAFPDSPRLYPKDPAARSETLLLEDWADEVLFLFPFYYRWAIDSNFKAFFDQMGAFLPLPLRRLVGPRIQKSAIKLLKARGIAHDTESERRASFNAALDALESRIARRPFLIGDEPTAADFAVYGPLEIVQAARLPEITPLLETRPKILAWMSAMKAAARA